MDKAIEERKGLQSFVIEEFLTLINCQIFVTNILVAQVVEMHIIKLGYRK